VDLSGVDPGDQRAEGLDILGAAEHQRAGHHRCGDGAAGDDDGVVLDRLVAADRGAPVLGVERREGAVTQRDADVAADRGEIEPVHLGSAERLADGRGPEPEPVGRGDERDIGQLGGQRPKGERGLKRCHPSAGDDDAKPSQPAHIAPPLKLGDTLKASAGRPGGHRWAP
jgi:hypothetical protein